MAVKHFDRPGRAGEPASPWEGEPPCGRGRLRRSRERPSAETVLVTRPSGGIRRSRCTVPAQPAHPPAATPACTRASSSSRARGGRRGTLDVGGHALRARCLVYGNRRPDAHGADDSEACQPLHRIRIQRRQLEYDLGVVDAGRKVKLRSGDDLLPRPNGGQTLV